MAHESHYAEEKLFEAIRKLTLGAGNIKERLIEAHARIAPLQAADFPPKLQAPFTQIMRSLNTKPALKARLSDTIISSSISQTLHHMKLKTAVRIAERMLKLHDDIAEYHCEIR